MESENYTVTASSSANNIINKLQENPGKNVIQSEFEAMLFGESSDEDTETINKMMQESSSGNLPTEHNGTSNAKRIENLENRDEIILTLMWLNNRLGAAYYNIVTSELFVMEDIHDDVINFNITKMLIRQCQPHYIVTIFGIFEDFLNCIKKLVMADAMEDNQSSSSSDRSVQTIFKTLSKKENNYETCYHRVRCLKLDSEPKDAENSERVTFLNALLDFKAHAMIHALGLLLRFIDKHWSTIALDPSGKASFISLNYITLENLVMIDDDSYKALNIVQTKYHPSFFKFGNASTKMQSGSLFALLNCCQSRPGVQFLWKTIRRPTRDIDVLNQRFDVIDFFLDPSNQSVVENLTTCLKDIYRLTSAILSRYLGPRARASDWQRLHKTVTNIIYIAYICENYDDKIQLFRKIVNIITDEMHYVKYFIELIVDFEASKRENTFIVRSDVDPQLDELRNLKHALPQLLTKMGEKDMQDNLPISVTSCNMVYLPNIGYVLAIKQWNRTPPEADDIPGLEFKFTINGVHYYKSPCARELDSSIGDIMSKITKRQSEIMLKLVRYINKHANSILSAIQLCAELDTLLSFSQVARNHNYVRPNVVKSQVIAVKQGRHPLQEFHTTYVPNDIYSGQGKSLVKIITGPNACGKSIYLKQVALIVFMAHIGCFVPAESATIGVMTHILTQIVTIDSISLDASAFLQTLRQINMALYASTPNSLVIMDEFGKGTSETNGLSLLAAVLDSFVERAVYCPHVFAATHIHRVTKLLPENPMIEAQTFEFITNNDESLAFLYRLAVGSTTCSFAHSVAKSAGLSEQLIKRSLEVFKNIKQGTLPSRIPEVQRKDTVKHIIERVVVPDVDFDLEELKSWVRQAILPSSTKF
ncbi:hypothetical protein HZH68_007988 [Vespula germanica]|uniref:DNA mismatch repair proteins mutS family domain-containing protein n=1 Tax=Vespula germanica TaxID=30212 RepID=A0A834K3L4_VESGE|nr:hypothetical protein HZH68_007988 [Vespula germanica]